MSDLRILTYNTQLRSWMMEVGWPPSIPPVDTAEDRARFLAAKIRASRQDYDLVCLNEVFDEDARSILSDELAGAYPYQVAKADLLYTRLVQPGLLHDLENKLFDLTFGPVFDVTASLLALKFEDSGLFFASRWPFDTVSIPTDVSDLLGGQAPALFPFGVPVVSFRPYGGGPECAGGDCRAAKGVLHVRIRRSSSEAYDLFLSHTQADTEHVDEHRFERDNQLAAVWDFVQSRTGGPPFPNPTFFLGDLNILGGAAEDAEQPDQWKTWFDTPGSGFTDHLRDLWGGVQCRGGGSGLTDPGWSATVAYSPTEQRLDFVAADPGPGLVAQHLFIDREVGAPPPPTPDGPSYQSDHRPLATDLARPHPFASPAQARRVTTVDFHDGPQGMEPGQMAWYRYDRAGTYEFDVLSGDPAVGYEVYLGSDLSRPRQIFRNEVDPDRGERFVLLAPFFVKVASRNRHEKFGYELRSHRHEGQSPDDALVLIPTNPYAERFPSTQFNGDSGLTPWSDEDSKWFRMVAPRVDLDPIHMRIDCAYDSGSSPIRLRVARIEPVGPPTLIDETNPARRSQSLEWDASRGEEFWVCVQRLDPSFAPVAFTLLADLDVSLLLGGAVGEPRLTCAEETSGWGADDIAVALSSDNGWSLSIPNSVIGDFDDDAVRDMSQWLTDTVAYRSEFTVTVIEEDDIDDDDVGQATIPSFETLPAWTGWTPIVTGDPTCRQGAVRIGVDGGVYTFTCRISRWDETL